MSDGRSHLTPDRRRLEYERADERPSARQVIGIFGLIFAGSALFWLGFALFWWIVFEPGSSVPPMSTVFAALASVATSLVGIVLGLISRGADRAAKVGLRGAILNAVILTAALTLIVLRIWMLRR